MRRERRTHMVTVIVGIALVALGYQIFVAFAAVRVMRAAPTLAALDPPQPAQWPRVSVIIPACNEADTIEAALRSRVAEGYPDAEYIVVDDRSTDGTGEILDRLAAEDPRVVAVHVQTLPDGWLGKVHAIHAGLSRATGEWVLLSDADVHHAHGTLRRAVAYCAQRGIDHLALFPWVWSSAFWLDGVMNSFLRMMAVASRAWLVPDPRSRVAVGGGNFALIRRAALDRAGGVEPLRMEVIDDAGLGQMLKWSGAHQAVVNGRGLVGLYFYRSIREVVLGMEKNGFAMLGRFSVVRFAIALALLTACELGAPLGLATLSGVPFAIAAAAFALGLVTHVMIARWLGRPLLPTLIAPFGWLVMCFAALRSMAITLRRGGITWRGTHYPLADLRRGRRLVHV